MKKYFVKPGEAVNVAFLKEKEYEAVYLCASKGEEKDPAFEGNYKAALMAGMKIGLYHYFNSVDENEPYTVDSAREGRKFAEAIKDKVYALPLGLMFRSDCKFTPAKIKSNTSEVYNGINAFAQYVDKKLQHSKKLVVFANAEQMEVIKNHPMNHDYTLEVIE